MGRCGIPFGEAGEPCGLEYLHSEPHGHGPIDYARLFREAVNLLWSTTARIQHLDVRAFLKREDVKAACDELKKGAA